MKTFIRTHLQQKDRYEVHVESDCHDNAGRDVIGSEIERKLLVKNLLLNLLSDDEYDIDDYNIEHLIEDCEIDEQAQMNTKSRMKNTMSRNCVPHGVVCNSSCHGVHFFGWHHSLITPLFIQIPLRQTTLHAAKLQFIACKPSTQLPHEYLWLSYSIQRNGGQSSVYFASETTKPSTKLPNRDQRPVCRY